MQEDETIFVRLIDGIEVLVPVKGTRVSEDSYKILDNPYLDLEDETSIWEFFPGDTVYVSARENRTVAEVLLEKSQQIPNRDAYELVFEIVSKRAHLERVDLSHLMSASEKVCRGLIPQTKHPYVQAWISENC